MPDVPNKKNILGFWKKKLLEAPSMIDAVILSLFTVLITLQPFYSHGEINIFETGLYLPGIQAILEHAVPFRDFFHLRGPFELYMPAMLMKIFGAHINVLYGYFYFGNVLCLVLGVFLAKELFKTKGMLYLFVPVLIARAFPRVEFTYWGGMRYAFGLLALWFLVRFFKREKLRDIFLAGTAAALGLFTSVEIGIYPTLGLSAAVGLSLFYRVQERRVIVKAFAAYLIGMAVIVLPYVFYLSVHQALRPYLDSVWTVVTDMQKVIDPHTVSIYPRNFAEAFQAMINPGHTNFKHMTPSYLYIVLLSYIFWKIKKHTLSKLDLFVVCLGVYGFVMYNTGFRGIWAGQFEMALQPEKILYFFLLEMFLLFLLHKSEGSGSLNPHEIINEQKRKWIGYAFNVFCWILILSSLGYATGRYNHRFFVFKYLRNKIVHKEIEHLRPYEKDHARPLAIPRARGVIVPTEQADDIEAVYAFSEKYIKKDETITTFFDQGTYNFLIDRRSLGRFPLVTMSWFNERWFAEFMAQLETVKPQYILLERNISDYWKAVYLAKEPNKKKFDAMMSFIKENYQIREETPKNYIMELKR